MKPYYNHKDNCANQYRLQVVDSNTFVVFFYHVPIVITVDPNFMKVLIIDVSCTIHVHTPNLELLGS